MKSALVAVTTAIVCFAILGGFMAVDRTVGHWYVPNSNDDLMTGEEFARYILDDWDRSVPQSVRDDEREKALAGEAEPPHVGEGSLAQLQAAFQRTGWSAVWFLVEPDIKGTYERKRYDIGEDCGGYLFGLHNRMAACNYGEWGDE